MYVYLVFIKVNMRIFQEIIKIKEGTENGDENWKKKYLVSGRFVFFQMG